MQKKHIKNFSSEQLLPKEEGFPSESLLKALYDLSKDLDKTDNFMGSLSTIEYERHRPASRLLAVSHVHLRAVSVVRGILK